MNNYSAFSYKAGSSFVHKTPAWEKLLFIPLFNILVFSLDYRVSIIFIILQFILLFCLKFSLKEQITDLTPVLWYAVFLYILGIISGTYFEFTKSQEAVFFSSLRQALTDVLNDEKTHAHVIKFLACNQSASLLFKTSTSLQLKEGIEIIELFIRRFLPVKKDPSFSIVISMFINFIPAVFKIWNQLKRAWIARNGKNSLKMYLVLFPILFSVGLKYAADTTKAVLNRSNRV